MPELLPPCAPLYPWLLDRCYRNLRVVRNPADPFSLHHDGQEVEIASRSTDPITDTDIMLIRRDGPPDDRWVCWCRSSNYRVDLLHFATRAVVLDALASIGHARPWALGRCWSSLTDEQAGRLTAEIVRRVGPDASALREALPAGVFGHVEDNITDRQGWWKRQRRLIGGISADIEWFRDDCGGLQQDGFHFEARQPHSTQVVRGRIFGDEGQRRAEAAALDHHYLLIEQLTPPEKFDA